MDAKQVAMEAELSELLQRASEVACRLQKLEQGRGTPHYDQNESAAHEVGQRLGRMVQKSRAGDIAAEHLPERACPDCRNKCPVETITRQKFRCHEAQVPCTLNGFGSVERMKIVLSGIVSAGRFSWGFPRCSCMAPRARGFSRE